MEGHAHLQKPETEKKKAWTVPRLREDAKSKASREANKRRGSICGSTNAASTSRKRPSPPGTTEDGSGLEDEFEDMPGSRNKSMNQSGSCSKGDSIGPALKDSLNAMKQDFVQSNKETVERIEARLERNEGSIAALERKVEDSEKKLGQKIVDEVTKQCAPNPFLHCQSRGTLIQGWISIWIAPRESLPVLPPPAQNLVD